jgi:hypothetical protein
MQKIAELGKEVAAGPDGITPKLLKALGYSILKPLLLIFEKSLNENKVLMERGKRQMWSPYIRKQQKRNR